MPPSEPAGPPRVACFGEMLLRLSAPGSERLLQSAGLDADFGGAEMNVAVSLAQLGDRARAVTVLPDNSLGRGARDALRRHGVETGAVRFARGRLGLYFVTPGAVRRPTDILYDREHSAFAVEAEAIDFEAALEGCDWLHLTGITAAVSAAAARAALRAVEVARRRSIPVSVDGNYRAKLWAAWGGDGPAVMRELVSYADVLFGDERDATLLLGHTFDAEEDGERRRAAEALFSAFPALKHVFSTERLESAVAVHELSAHAFARDGAEAHAEAVPLVGIVDRIGSGDAFAAGVLHGRLAGWTEVRALTFGLAAAAFKHSIPGDFNLATEADILAGLPGASLSVRR